LVIRLTRDYFVVRRHLQQAHGFVEAAAWYTLRRFGSSFDKKTPSMLDEVCRPLLPTAERLLPYLRSIDESRWYSNWGDLAKTFERRLSAKLGLAQHECTVANNATSGITAALVAVADRASPARPFCLMPSYTYVATAAAALGAGYVPYFVDVDPNTFAMNPETIAAHPMLSKAGAIIAVAPYGRSIASAAWQKFSKEFGLPVVIDAAAGFDALLSGEATIARNVPIVLSFHATKAFGIGEGGAIVCRGSELARRCHRALNLGFLGSREARMAGINGKLSEYHAAVGLAELDGWRAKRRSFIRVARAYHRAAKAHGLDDRILTQRTWASSYALFFAESAAAARKAAARLRSAGLGFRWWYGNGVHREPAYRRMPADPLPVTEDIARRLIGLPVWVELDDATIDCVVAALAGNGRTA